MKVLGWKKEGILLLGIVLAALALRLTTYKYEYLLGIDPFHHYRIAEYLAEKGQLPVIWPLSLAPTGAAITEPAGLYYISVLLHKLLEPFGFSFVQAFKLAPPLFGAITILPAYLLAEKLFDRRAALLSSLVLAFLPAFIYRAFAGFYRGDVFSVFFMLWGFYLFLASLEGTPAKRAATSVLAGISFGFMGLVWNGFLFGFGVLTLSFLLISSASYYRGNWSWAPLQSYILSAGLGILLIKSSILLYPNTAAPISTLAKYIYPGTVAFSGALGALDLALKGRGARERVVSGGLLILATALILLVIFPGFLESLSKTTSYGALGSDDPILGRISELGGPTLKRAEETGIAEVSIEEKYGMAHLLKASGLPAALLGSPLGLLTAFPALVGFLSLLKAVWKERRTSSLFLLVWVFTSLYLLVSAVRFAFLAALPIAVLWGEGLMILKSWKIPDRRAFGKVVVAAFLLPVVLNGALYASERTPDMDKDWGEALMFLKGQEPGIVLSWWDAGSWVQGVAGFPTVVDSVHGQNVDRVKAVAEVLLENNTRYGHIKDFLEGHGVRYIAVSSDLIYQLGGIQAAANASGYTYSVLNPSGTGAIEGKKAAIYGKERNFLAYRDEGGIQVLYIEGGKAYRLEKVHYREKEGLVARVSAPPPPVLEGGVYATKEFIIYASPRLEGSFLNSLVLLDGEGFSGLRQIYSNPRVRIYKVVPQ